MPSTGRPNRWRLLIDLISGFILLALVAGVLAGVANMKFFVVYLAVLAVALLCCGLAMTWLILWARRDGQLGQFGIGSLFFLTCFAAIFLGAAKFIATHVGANFAGQGFTPLPGTITFFGTFLLLSTVIGVPVLAAWSTALVWLAVWVIRRGWVQRSIRRMRRS